jgi:hypothetical protein
MDRTRLIALVAGLAVAVVVLVLLSRGSPPGFEHGDGDREGRPDTPEEVAPGPEKPESGGPSVEKPEGPALLVAVTGPDGRPLGGAGVILARDGRPVGRGTTAGDGSVTLRAPGGEGEVVVLPGWAPPRRQAASLEAGRVDVVIPAGSAIEGRVLEDGEPPAEPLELMAWSRERFEGFEKAPQPFRGETRTSTLVTRTGLDGTFAFRGLPPAWTAFVVVPRSHVLVDPAGNGRSLTVEAPTSNLLVRVRRLAVLTARFVNPDGSPAVGAEANLRHASGSSGASADAEGRIRILLPLPPVEEARLVATDGDRIVSREWHLTPKQLSSDLDLGDLKLPGRRRVVLLVRDRKGSPVAAARAVAESEEHARPVGPSGAEGELRILLSEADPRVRVAAPGHGFARLVVPEGEGPHPVTLPGGNALTVRFEERNGKPPAAPLWVRVEGEVPLFAWGEEGPDPLATVPGPRPDMWGRGDDGEYARLLVRGGRFRLDGLAPGRVVTIRATDPVTRAVVAKEEVTLGAAEHREITVPLEGVLRTLVGKVVDEDGAPVAGAIVLATVSERGGLRAKAGADGSFEIPGLRVDRVHLRVERYGHAPVERADLVLPDGERTIEIVLPPGRTVRVEVVDAAGASVEPAEVGATAEGLTEPFDGLDEKPGTYVLKDLPPGRVTLFALFAGRRIEVEHDTATAKARIVVPRTGSLAVRIPFPLEKPIIHRIRLEPVEGGTEVSEDVDVDGKKDRTIVVPAVLPGRYRIRLEVLDDDAESEEDVWEKVADGPEATVRVGVRATAEITR